MVFEPITLYELLSLLVAVAGFVVVIVTLALLVRQTSAMTTQTAYLAESLKTSTYQSVVSQVFAIDELIVNCPELRPYFLRGEGH